MMPTAARTLTPAKKTFASALNWPPRLNRAPWFTRGGTGPFALTSGLSLGGASGSNWTNSLNAPGINSFSPDRFPSWCRALKTPYFDAWSATNPTAARVNRRAR